MSPPAATTESNGSNGNVAKDEKSMPYQGEQPYGMPNDLVIAGIMDLDNTDEKLWVCLVAMSFKEAPLTQL